MNTDVSPRLLSETRVRSESDLCVGLLVIGYSEFGFNCFFLLGRIILHSLFLSFTNRGYQPKIIAAPYLRSGTSTFKINFLKDFWLLSKV